MRKLKPGEYFGHCQQTISTGDLIVTDSYYYSIPGCEWHYHENMYFALVRKGNFTETGKNYSYECETGTLILHNSEDPHRNHNYSPLSQSFHIEISNRWLVDHLIKSQNFKGSFILNDPGVKQNFTKIYKEFRLKDDASLLSIQGLLLQTFCSLLRQETAGRPENGSWINHLKEIIHEEPIESITLHSLATKLNVHPVHLSRTFPTIFHCSFGDYIRKMKVEKSIVLLRSGKYSLTDIAYKLNFSDQSHFNRVFKAHTGFTPSKYRSLRF
jgi:AraC family transcriptional regulator